MVKCVARIVTPTPHPPRLPHEHKVLEPNGIVEAREAVVHAARLGDDDEQREQCHRDPRWGHLFERGSRAREVRVIQRTALQT